MEGTRKKPKALRSEQHTFMKTPTTFAEAGTLARVRDSERYSAPKLKASTPVEPSLAVLSTLKLQMSSRPPRLPLNQAHAVSLSILMWEQRLKVS